MKLARETGAIGGPPASSFVLISEAVGIYLQLKGNGRPVTVHRAAERACRYLTDACGDKHLDAYAKKDVDAFRDNLLERGRKGSTLSRIFDAVTAMTAFAASEMGREFDTL